MSRTCLVCNSSEIDEDSASGEAACMVCGTVVEESHIVSDVAFQEVGSGAHEVIGQFVSQERASGGSGGAGQPKPESREVTYYKGKKLIKEIASQLRINQHCSDTAYNFFKMCVNRNFTRGRVRVYVVAACLYMTCRLENTSHLLLDFSDVTQVNVFDLGRTLNFLTRSLKINLPTTDPCLYVLRFAIMLDFGDKQKEVVSLATRIVQRMKRDWMATGRRPTGICGAALLLAARAYNVNRGVSDIVKVVHISETVVRKRLDEFANTASGNLTIDEFSVVDLENCEDPPAYQEARMRRQRNNKRLEEETQAEEFENVHEEVENALRDRMKRSPYGAMLIGQSNDLTVPELRQAQEHVQSELIENIYAVAESVDDHASDVHLSYQQHTAIYGPSLRSLGLERSSQQQSSAPAVTGATTLHSDEFMEYNEFDEDIDDDEIDGYILSERESKMKEELWMIRNGKHMEEMEKRRRAKQEEEEQKDRENPRKRRNGTKRPPINTSNLNDAMLQVIQEKRLSNKINYDILKEIDTVQKFELPPPVTTISKSPEKRCRDSSPELKLTQLKPIKTSLTPTKLTNLDTPAVTASSVTTSIKPSPQQTADLATSTTTSSLGSPLSQKPADSVVNVAKPSSLPNATASAPPSSAPAMSSKFNQSRYKLTKMLPTSAIRAKKS